jgi:hypothetical protein
MNERTVSRNLLQGAQEPGPLGRRNAFDAFEALDAQSEAALVAMLLDGFSAGQSMSKKKFLQILRERHRKTTTRGWVNAFIGKHLPDLQPCHSIPQEDMRLAVPMSQLEEHINTLKVHPTWKCAEHVSNLDELGSADWEDRKVKKVIVSAAVPKERCLSFCIPPPTQYYTPGLCLCGGRCDDFTAHYVDINP